MDRKHWHWVTWCISIEVGCQNQWKMAIKKHQKCEKMNKYELKITKMMQVVRNVIWLRTGVDEGEKLNFNYWQKSKMYIESECLSKTTGTCM